LTLIARYLFSFFEYQQLPLALTVEFHVMRREEDEDGKRRRLRCCGTKAEKKAINQQKSQTVACLT
jgi:hypothetical protein